MTERRITIGNAQGFWGDSCDAPARLLAQYPGLDYLTLDYLAEVSLSILAGQRAKDPTAGYARDFIGVVRSIADHWKRGGHAKIVCNAGGLNPEACARATLETLAASDIMSKRVGLVTGDDVLPVLRQNPSLETFRNWETHQSASAIIDTMVTANAYIGAEGVAEALSLGADIVVTGRVADPSLTLGICRHEFGWTANDFDQLAAGTIAGHVLECGTQACGGIFTHWLDLDDPAHIGFPVVEMVADGTFFVTKPAGTGGVVNEKTVKEQLLYEIGDPSNYLSPDCRVNFTTLRVQQEGVNLVKVSGANGSAPTSTYKVSATHRDGYWASGMLTIFGRDAVKKAQRCGQIILSRLRDAGHTYQRTNIECLGANSCAPGVIAPPYLLETVLRVSVADPDKAAVERFCKEIAPLVTSGPQGTTGYAAGRPKVHPVFGYWPCLIEKDRVTVTASIFAS